ncbi:MAG TPA: DUF2336 domain-containing protein [Candidatus Binatia bacterium]|nr:DUF2336 domain-containing protein [Candidatus Binatia bacterium]
MIDYQNAKTLAANADPETRRRLAERGDLQPEILYFLAEDVDAEVRAAIAANLATPRHADRLLAEDADSDVRERLAHKIGRLAPKLSSEEREHIRELTLDVISILAADRAVRVRRVIAEALKDLTDAPVEVIQRLARDVEIEVAGPILESSPLLTDKELVSIIESKPIQGALEAIARRRRLGMHLADALVAAAVSAPYGVLAVTVLLKNHDAEIGPDTMERILDLAPGFGDWHAPLVERPALTGGVIRRLAQFVSRTLLGALKCRPDADPETVAAVAETEQRRAADEDFAEESTPVAAAHSAHEDDVEVEHPPVGEPAIMSAIAAGEINAVAAALARDSGFPRALVRKVFASGSTKAIVALAWKAKYSMPLAVALQTGPGGIASGNALRAPEGDDDAYPLPDSELEWQLDLIGAPAKPLRSRHAFG